MKKGFTLIELLAVIVILAVIALIATPIILGIIDDTKKSAFKDSAYGISQAAKNAFVEIMYAGSDPKDILIPTLME
jgi:type IV pilus assembly protein PilA